MSLSEFEQMLLGKLDDLCRRMTAIETEWNNHIDNITKKEKSKREKIYIAIALSSTIIAVYQTVLS